MRRLGFLSCFALLYASAACLPTLAPTPLPTSTLTPTQQPTAATPPSIPSLSLEVVTADFPPDIPACPDFKALDKPPQFSWPSIEKVMEPGWLYYRCAARPQHLAAIYREQMQKPQYNWMEAAWVVRAEGTMGVYLHTASQGWLYLWFLTDTSSVETSVLVIAMRKDAPLELECH